MKQFSIPAGKLFDILRLHMQNSKTCGSCKHIITDEEDPSVCTCQEILDYTNPWEEACPFYEKDTD